MCKLFSSCTFVKCMDILNFEINYLYCRVNSKMDSWYCCFMQNSSLLRLRCILDAKSLLCRSSKRNYVNLFLYNFIQIKSSIWKEKGLQKNQKWTKTITAYFTFILSWKIDYGIWSWLLNFFKADNSLKRLTFHFILLFFSLSGSYKSTILAMVLKF